MNASPKVPLTLPDESKALRDKLADREARAARERFWLAVQSSKQPPCAK